MVLRKEVVVLYFYQLLLKEITKNIICEEQSLPKKCSSE
jgi:hypothetical protein